MFDSVIEKLKELKSKLPGGNSKEELEEKTDVEITTTGIDVEKTSTKKMKFFSKKSDEDDEDEDDEEEEEEGPNLISKLIRAFVVLGLVYFGVTEFVLEKEPAPSAVVKKRKAPPKGNKNKKQKQKQKQIKQATKKIVKKPEAQPAQPSEKTVNNAINNQAKEELTQKTDELKEPEKAKPSDVIKEPIVQKPIEIKEESKKVVKETEKVKNDDFESMMSDLEAEVDSAPENSKPETFDKQANSMEDQLNKIVKKVEEEKGQKIEKVEYVDPPSYEQFGRGLVYNCKKKHWACVDGNAWLDCRQNDLWTDQNKKAKECMVSDVYASIKDCRIIQTDRINQVVIPECE